MSKESLIDFAYDIIDSQRELLFLRSEVERLKEYEQKYHELLSQSIKHGEVMMGNMLTLVLTPGVTEALSEHANKAESVQN